MVDIQAAAPFPGIALDLPLANVPGTLGQSNRSKAADSSDAASHGSDVSPDPSPDSRDQNNTGGVATSQPNNNASPSTPPSQDPPGAEIRNCYADPTILSCDKSGPHYTHQHHYLTPQQMAMSQEGPPNPSNVPADHSAHTPPHSNITAVIDPTGGADPLVQCGPSGRPQPFQRPLTTVLEDAPDILDGGATS